MIEPEEVVRVVLLFHRLQASQVRTKRIPDGLVALFIQAGEIEVLAITREELEGTKNLPSPVDACRVILGALPVGLDSDEIRRGTITKGSVLGWYPAQCTPSCQTSRVEWCDGLASLSLMRASIASADSSLRYLDSSSSASHGPGSRRRRSVVPRGRESFRSDQRSVSHSRVMTARRPHLPRHHRHTLRGKRQSGRRKEHLGSDGIGPELE